MQIPFTPSQCHIDLGAIRRNFLRLGSPQNLMPVIKADAYGHGLLQTAKALEQAGARRFAVGMVAEGAALRENGSNATIMPLLGCLNPNDWQMAKKYGLLPLVGSFEDIKAAAAMMAQYPDEKLDIAIKCDTGMRRLGFNPENAYAVCEALKGNPQLNPVMLVSHLACADMPEENDYTNAQTSVFNEFANILQDYYPKIVRSLGNSASTLKQASDDILRPGLAIYGYDPFADAKNRDLEPAMSVSAPIIHIRELAPGQSLSYGRLFTAVKPTRIAVIACGYATGLNRSLSGKMQMLVNGRRARQVGRICMGMTMLDITAHPDVKVGDLVWILGGPTAAGQKPVTADELAQMLGTISYELLCSLGSLNPRVYTD